MPRIRPSLENQRGIALVMALLVLVVLSVLALVLMTTVNTESKLTSHDVSKSTALNLAEAGVAEALSRITNGDINFGANTRGTAVIFNQIAGSLPTMGVDTTAVATAQPTGAWLSYSTSNKSAEQLTVNYKTNNARTVVYKYDISKNPPVQTVSGLPIYVIKSTGRSGRDVRHVTTEVVQKPILVNCKGAVAIGKNTSWSGNDYMCGYDHRSDTPIGKGKNGRNVAGGCNEIPASNMWETGGTNLPGVWATGTIGPPGGGVSGIPATSPSQPGFYAGPWEVLGMTQSQFWAWVGPRTAVAPPIPTGIIYLDNDAITQNQLGAFTFNGGTGEGFLYVDGNLTLNGNFNYRGLIYVEGNLSINSWTWVLGGVVIRGVGAQDWHSNGTILYSKDAITEKIAKYSGQFVTLSWREN